MAVYNVKGNNFTYKLNSKYKFTMVRHEFKCNGETIIISEHFCTIPDAEDYFHEHEIEICDRITFELSEDTRKQIEKYLRELKWSNDQINFFIEIIKEYLSCAGFDVDFDDHIDIRWTFNYTKFRNKLHELEF